MCRKFVHALPFWSRMLLAVARADLFRLLRKDQHAVGADVKRAVEGEAVALATPWLRGITASDVALWIWLCRIAMLKQLSPS